MKLKLFLPAVAIMLLLAACGTGASKEEGSQNAANKKSEYPQLVKEVQENERLVEMETSMGTIKIKLFPEYAPKAVENFITHSEEGYYDGLTFHRVMQDFMIQGGDPQGTGMGGESIYGGPFEDEFSDKLFNLRGALSMANAGPNTNGSQFFIVQNSTVDESLKQEMEKAGYPEEIIKAYEKGGTPWLDSKHTVFGQVIDGMDIVDKIATTETGAGDKPVEDVVIKKIKVVK
ncbi:peptidylprolyl isomerase [Cytobacillus dafuensis]|uniref:Peptidyl-prolyl cis-trans isomerase n=1 Tax=Cytobacillus dafuensis TaxID=1742359 RepID=A0A5B8Z7M9_CYTDA|nr:peptidylprolyl isomerase [Cytobacillus dafuensis]QED49142.1 peptidylprolyl isomerase [Cytobacillus dafuensis]